MEEGNKKATTSSYSDLKNMVLSWSFWWMLIMGILAICLYNYTKNNNYIRNVNEQLNNLLVSESTPPVNVFGGDVVVGRGKINNLTVIYEDVPTNRVCLGIVNKQRTNPWSRINGVSVKDDDFNAKLNRICLNEDTKETDLFFER